MFSPHPALPRRQMPEMPASLSVILRAEGQLTGDCERVANLTLSCPELAEDFSNTASLDATSEEGVKLLGPRGY